MPSLLPGLLWTKQNTDKTSKLTWITSPPIVARSFVSLEKAMATTPPAGWQSNKVHTGILGDLSQTVFSSTVKTSAYIEWGATLSRSPILWPCSMVLCLLSRPSVCLHWHTYRRWGGSDPEDIRCLHRKLFNMKSVEWYSVIHSWSQMVSIPQ